MSEWARPFRVTYPDGTVFQGAQFPDGRCVVALPGGGFHVAVSFEALELSPEAITEWADGGTADAEEVQARADAAEVLTAVVQAYPVGDQP